VNRWTFDDLRASRVISDMYIYNNVWVVNRCSNVTLYRWIVYWRENSRKTDNSNRKRRWSDNKKPINDNEKIIKVTIIESLLKWFSFFPLFFFSFFLSFTLFVIIISYYLWLTIINWIDIRIDIMSGEICALKKFLGGGFFMLL